MSQSVVFGRRVLASLQEGEAPDDGLPGRVRACEKAQKRKGRVGQVCVAHSKEIQVFRSGKKSSEDVEFERK